MGEVDPVLDLDRLQRLSEFWNWLPAYRAVAETEHVRTAAQRLRVSPSALSRSIGLLEESVGEQLFERQGRGIQLNRSGREFLAKLRVAMRLIDEGLQSLESANFLGNFHIAMPEELSRKLLPALSELQTEHPELVVRVHSIRASDVIHSLLEGSVDLAFVSNPASAKGLIVEKFVETPNGIYCGEGHPLFEQADVSTEALADHGFVATEIGDADVWRADLERRVQMYVSRLQAAVDAAAVGRVLAVLPDHVAEPHVERGTLWRVPLDVLPSTAFHVVRRKPVVEEDRNTRIADFLRARAA